MKPIVDRPNRSHRWIAIDIGGANLKGAHSDGHAISVPFEVWRWPHELGTALGSLAALFSPFDRIAVTMTAELCDCYRTKSEGVSAILDAVEQAFGAIPSLVWGTDGVFHSLHEIRRHPILAAAANWLALAIVAARMIPVDRGILIDVGSTTTDLIPLDRGQVAARGRSDSERLRLGELVYAGVRRTPVCALATELNMLDDRPVGLAAELFSTTHDIFLLLGDLSPDPSDHATADGRPATLDAARERLARMIGADRDTIASNEVLALARSAEGRLLHRLKQSVERACGPTIGTPEVAVVAGSGEFLARRLAEEMLQPSSRIFSLGEVWGAPASTAACAIAMLTLATEHTLGE